MLRPFTYRVLEVVDVTDGDTVDVMLDLGFGICARKRVRLAGINAPESRTTDRAEKALGLEAKAWLHAAVVGCKALLVNTDKPDSTEKYGRVLGRLYVAGLAESINDRMVREGYALPYTGEGPKADVQTFAAARARAEEKRTGGTADLVETAGQAASPAEHGGTGTDDSTAQDTRGQARNTGPIKSATNTAQADIPSRAGARTRARGASERPVPSTTRRLRGNAGTVSARRK